MYFFDIFQKFSKFRFILEIVSVNWVDLRNNFYKLGLFKKYFQIVSQFRVDLGNNFCK